MSYAASRAASGPLNSLLNSMVAQWAVVGGTLFYLVAPDDLRMAVRAFMIRQLSEQPQSNSSNNSNRNAYPPIVLQTSSAGPAGAGGSLLRTMVTCVVGASCVWVGYGLLSELLPFKEYLPVTQRIFDKTSKKLASSIYNVKDVLGKQILNLFQKTEQLQKTTDDINKDVKHCQNTLDLTRADLGQVSQQLDSVHDTVQTNQHLQTYTARGVKLLVSAVSSILPGDDRITRELQDYIRAGDLVYKNSSHNSNKTLDSPEREHPKLVIAPKPTQSSSEHSELLKLMGQKVDVH